MAKRKSEELQKLDIDIMTEMQKMKKELKSELSREIKKGFEELKEWISLNHNIREDARKSIEESLSFAELLQPPQCPIFSAPVPTHSVISRPSYIGRTHEALNSSSNQYTVDGDEVSSTQMSSGDVPKLDKEKSTLQSNSKTNTTMSSKASFKEREAAYFAARQRFFPEDNSEIKEIVAPKPRNVPVVARRMIAHALGRRVSSNSSGGVTSTTHQEPEKKNQELSGREKSVGHQNVNLRNSRETAAVSIKELRSEDRKIVDKSQVRHAGISERASERNQKKPTSSDADKSVNCVPPRIETLGQVRMFAHALRQNGTKELNGPVMKTNLAMPIDKD